MKTIKTASFIKLMSDYKRQPGSFPNENLDGQMDVINDSGDPKDDNSIIRRWKKEKKIPTKKIYQLGLDVPLLEKSPAGML